MCKFRRYFIAFFILMIKFRITLNIGQNYVKTTINIVRNVCEEIGERELFFCDFAEECGCGGKSREEEERERPHNKDVRPNMCRRVG